jgi:hypothetical protein
MIFSHRSCGIRHDLKIGASHLLPYASRLIILNDFQFHDMKLIAYKQTEKQLNRWEWFEVLTAVCMKMAVYRPDDGGSTDLWNSILGKWKITRRWYKIFWIDDNSADFNKFGWVMPKLQRGHFYLAKAWRCLYSEFQETVSDSDATEMRVAYLLAMCLISFRVVRYEQQLTDVQWDRPSMWNKWMLKSEF